MEDIEVNHPNLEIDFVLSKFLYMPANFLL